MYICSCSVRSDEYRCKTKHAFVYDNHFKHLQQSKNYGDLINNTGNAPIFVLEDNDRDTKLNLKHSLKISLVEFPILLLPLDWSPCTDGVRIVGRWCSTPYKESKETLDSIPIWFIALLFTRCHCLSSASLPF